MRRLVTANRVGAAVIAVCLPLLVLQFVLLPQGETEGRYDDEVVVPAGGAVTRDGLRLSIRGDGEFGAADGLTTPAGTAVVAVALLIVPVDRSAFADHCEVTLTAPGGGARRTWRPDGVPEEYGYARGTAFADTCDPSPSGRTTVEADFLAPAGTARAATLDVTLTTGTRRTLVRLALPPQVSG